MDRTSTDMTIADYAAAYERGDIEINKNYQRSDKVWPEPAKSFLIETILLGYPIPKLSLHQLTDVRTRKTRKQVVDGQQRSATIWSFLEGGFKVAGNSEVIDAAGRDYESLPEDLQQKILDYSLSFDLFVNTSEEEVREVFRRINSFTVPLNAEEQRYAEFQGRFKWFIYRIARDYDVLFVESGLFTSKQIVRMQDTKWLTEISHAILYGITTTSKTQLTNLYRSRDRRFDEESDVAKRFKAAFDHLLTWEDLHKTALFKQFVAYSLTLALMHCIDPIDTLQEDFPLSGPVVFGTDTVAALSSLAEVLANADDKGAEKSFVLASTTGTNVKAARITRFQSFCRALTGG